MPSKFQEFILKMIRHIPWRHLTIGLFCFGFASAVYAAGDVGAIDQALQGIKNILTGKTARSLAVIAIIGIGYMTLSGKMDWKVAILICLGIGIIFGASDIAKLLGVSE